MKNRLRERINEIDSALDKYLAVKDNTQKIIYEAMRYSVFAGGKRLRPILMWETALMCGGEWEDVENFACALEMVHTYSLIHDDLPAMDNDELRRGLPTNHIKFGEDIAILAGDALLTKAFEVISSGNYHDPAKAMHAINIFAAAAGTEGMVGGQIIDLASEGKDISLDELQCMHLLKTGALIRSACVIGAVMAGAEANEITAVDNFAKYLGIAFQIRDDILDVIGTEIELGKPIGSDIEEEKNTYVKLYGIERSKELVIKYSEKAKAELNIFGERAGFLKDLTDHLSGRNN
ncbi:MAG: polyprenyl synthetase family protein [Oscillospiraceae bacterium]|nr:polyprenyl synthetase family protein [Oscillospiraceae bacterium]